MLVILLCLPDERFSVYLRTKAERAESALILVLGLVALVFLGFVLIFGFILAVRGGIGGLRIGVGGLSAAFLL